jgi:hypothetical protein
VSEKYFCCQLSGVFDENATKIEAKFFPESSGAEIDEKSWSEIVSINS